MLDIIYQIWYIFCKIEWFLQNMNFYLQRMVLDWGIFPSFVIKLGIYFGDFEWFLQRLNFHSQKLFLVWGIFPSFANVKYHM
jgi:hypothetical protein